MDHRRQSGRVACSAAVRGRNCNTGLRTGGVWNGVVGPYACSKRTEARQTARHCGRSITAPPLESSHPPIRQFTAVDLDHLVDHEAQELLDALAGPGQDPGGVVGGRTLYGHNGTGAQPIGLFHDLEEPVMDDADDRKTTDPQEVGACVSSTASHDRWG